MLTTRACDPLARLLRPQRHGGSGPKRPAGRVRSEHLFPIGMCLGTSYRGWTGMSAAVTQAAGPERSRSQLSRPHNRGW